MRLFSELRRRNVLRMAVLYAVAAWLIMQVAEVVIALAELPGWSGQLVLALLAVGFPIALIFSWFYELTPEGISLEKDVDGTESMTHASGRRMDFIVISLLAAAVILFAYDKWWIGPPLEKSIAVLAFDNMSGDPEQEYFSDGISEELLNVLAQIPELKVISRTSAFSFKGQSLDATEIAKRLNVAHILEGSVRKSGNNVRVTAQLINADDGFHVWSKSYDRELNDIFAVQDEIAAAISDALQVRLVLASGKEVAPTVIKAANADAYDAYLKGRELIRKRGGENLSNAVQYLERALRLDDNFAPAHAQLAIATALLVDHPDAYGELSLEEARRIAIPHLDRAQAIEPDLAEAHEGRALLAHFAGDLEAEIEHARKALESNPSYVDAMNSLHIALSYLGRYEESDAILNQLMVIDPLTIAGRANYISWLGGQGRIDEVHAMADQLLMEDPGWGYGVHAETSLIAEGKIAEGLTWALKRDREAGRASYITDFAFLWVGEYDEARRTGGIAAHWVDLYEGRFDDAVRATKEILRENPDRKNNIDRAAYFLYLAGRNDEALPLFERLLELVPEGRPISSSNPLASTMALALARRKAGNEEGAQAAAQIARLDHAARRAAGRKNWNQDLAEAMIAAFDNDPEGVITALKSALQRGLRFSLVFDNPIFEDLQDEPRFKALRYELDAILAAEHDKVLQFICLNNPVPDYWEPLPETCAGVVRNPAN